MDLRKINKNICRLADIMSNGAMAENGPFVVDTIKQCLLDDVNGNGSNLIPFTRYLRLFSDGTSEVIQSYNSTLTGPYSPSNIVDPNTLGIPATGKSGMICIENGQTWSPSPLVKAYGYSVISTSNGSTFTDSFQQVTTLPDNHVATWQFYSVESDGEPIITAGTGAKLIINYTTY